MCAGLKHSLQRDETIAEHVFLIAPCFRQIKLGLNMSAGLTSASTLDGANNAGDHLILHIGGTGQ